ncbi:hypothetical protein BDF14DRAFT_1417175 [Spinellus fusiger]|nr:hypothetical protein BDF14DRAFT_1417175 [Spinellus fusiger]
MDKGQRTKDNGQWTMDNRVSILLANVDSWLFVDWSFVLFLPLDYVSKLYFYSLIKTERKKDSQTDRQAGRQTGRQKEGNVQSELERKESLPRTYYGTKEGLLRMDKGKNDPRDLVFLFIKVLLKPTIHNKTMQCRW